jgi:antitoxin HicB
MKKRDRHTGASFDSFLEEEGILEEVEAIAIKRVIAWQIEQEMAANRVSKTAMAERLHTSRSQLDRLLDPTETAVQIDTIARAAHAVGLRMKISVERIAPEARRRIAA